MSSSSSDEEYDSDGSSNELYLSKDNLHQMQKERFEIFKTQDLERGLFDVTFEAEGKILHAHKFIIASVSEPMAAMLSSRWTTNKDEPIKIESYSYDNFYEFLCFLYISACKLTDENIFRITDMAEFYGVSCLKKSCDKFLSDMQNTPETIEEMHDFAEKYSLLQCLDSIKHFIRYGRNGIYNVEKFLTYKKPFVEFLSTIDRDADYRIDRDDDNSTEISESEFFELVYKWAEHQVHKQKPADDENFDVHKAVENELESILPNIKFGNMNLEFLMDFVVEKGFILSPNEFSEFFKAFQRHKHSDTEKNLFKSVYELAEKHALKKQMIAGNDESFNVAASIKADLSQIIPKVKFFKMDKTFLNKFVIGNGIITKEQLNHIYDTRVEVTNNGKLISGVFKDKIGIRKAVQKNVCYATRGSTTKRRFTKFKFTVPSTPSTVTKMKGVAWYLCLEMDGILAFKHNSVIQRRDYLIAEMKSNTQFQLIPNEITRLTASYRNVDAL